MPFRVKRNRDSCDGLLTVRVDSLFRARAGPRRSAPVVAAMSFAIHKQVHPPTGVDHAVAAYFTHPIGDGGPPNLVVMQANHLTVFAIRRDPSADASGDAALGAKAVAMAKKKKAASADEDDDDDESDDSQMSLEVVAEFDLNGTVGSIAVIAGDPGRRGTRGTRCSSPFARASSA